MADTDVVMARIARRPNVSYPVLVPNMHGLEAAIAAGAEEIAIFAAASEALSQKNINCSIRVGYCFWGQTRIQIPDTHLVFLYGHAMAVQHDNKYIVP